MLLHLLKQFNGTEKWWQNINLIKISYILMTILKCMTFIN